MKLKQSAESHKDDKPTFKNNKWFAENGTVCCLKSADLELDTFKNDGTMRWAVNLAYIEYAMRQSGKWTFGSQADGKGKWDGTFAECDEWPVHNAVLKMNVPGNPNKGYYIDFGDESGEGCPCKHKPGRPGGSNGAAAPVPQPAHTEADLVAYSPEGQELYRASEKERKEVELLATALRKPIPENLDDMTSADVAAFKDSLLRAHIGV